MNDKHLRTVYGVQIILDGICGFLSAVATMAAGVMPPNQLIRKFASYPRQRELAVALPDIRRIKRTLFIIEWLHAVDLQRRAQIGLRKRAAD